MENGKPGFKRFVLRSMLALLPVALFVALYAVVDPFHVVHSYDGVSVAPGDTLERVPNKRYVAFENFKRYNPQRHFDSFIFGSSISSNFLAEAWKPHLPDTASVYHFTEGAQTLTGIRDELRYLTAHGYPVRHALLIIEEEMLRRPKRYGEMPFIPHYEVSPEVNRLQFHLLHFNAFRDFDMMRFKLWPTTALAGKLLEDGKVAHVPCARVEAMNEDYSTVLDSTIAANPDAYYADMPWLVDMQPLPNPMPLSIDADAEAVLRDIAAVLREYNIDYVVIVPPRFRSPALSPIDLAVLCEILGNDRVNDFSADSTLLHDLHSYYDGIHILTPHCTDLINRSYQPRLKR